MAEREGFEPSIPFRVCRFSKPVPSASRPSLHRNQDLPMSKNYCHGGSRIRTYEGLSPLAVFKTAAFSRSAIPPRRHRRLLPPFEKGSPSYRIAKALQPSPCASPRGPHARSVPQFLQAPQVGPQRLG